MHMVRVNVSSVYGITRYCQQREADYQINQALRRLYDLGCRRMKIRSLPRTGDGLRFEVSGE